MESEGTPRTPKGIEKKIAALMNTLDEALSDPEGESE
jgi:hypothetical protein